MFTTISSCCITNESISQSVADKLLTHHIEPMQIVNDSMGVKVWASAKSGYRPLTYELHKGRSGRSQHVFKQLGAVDWTCENFGLNKEKLLRYIEIYTKYNRMTMYSDFIHCDFKTTRSGKREVYNSHWVKKYEVLS